MSIWVWLGRGKEGWEMSGQPTSALNGFLFSLFLHPSKYKENCPPMTSLLPCGGPGHKNFFSAPQMARNHSCPVLFSFWTPPACPNGSSVRFLQEAFQRLPAITNGSLPALWPHKRAPRSTLPAMLSNCLVETDSPLNECVCRSPHPERVP